MRSRTSTTSVDSPRTIRRNGANDTLGRPGEWRFTVLDAHSYATGAWVQRVNGLRGQGGKAVMDLAPPPAIVGDETRLLETRSETTGVPDGNRGIVILGAGRGSSRASSV
jgi:hypothetical protein